MPAIQYPTINVKYFAINEVYLKADDASVNKYCSDQGITLVSYEPEQKRFSNDGGLAYQYWGKPQGVTGGTDMWVTEFGYAQVVQELVYS
jgi:hypothetical protein